METWIFSSHDFAMDIISDGIATFLLIQNTLNISDYSYFHQEKQFAKFIST